MSDVEYLATISDELVRLNNMGDLFLAISLTVLLAYMFYTVLKWFSRF
jgi:hypothetical protein